MLDSGLGGLTVLTALRALAGGTDIIYFADTANVPYGDRPLDEVAALGRRIIKRLLTHEPALIIVASGTTCAAFDAAGKPNASVPVLGVVETGARAACAATRNGSIGVVATNGTVRSGIFERKILDCKPDAAVRSVGAPALVPLVETGAWASPRARDAVFAACAPLVSAGCDTAVLGCTHFPHLVAWFAAALGAEVQIVDPGAACAALAAERIGGLAAQEGRIAFEVSGDPEEFAANATALSGVDIHTLTHVRL